MRDTFTHSLFGKDDMVRTSALKDSRVFLVCRFGPNIRNSKIGQSQHSQNAGFNICADRNHGSFKVGYPQLLKGRCVCAISFNHSGKARGKFMDYSGIGIGTKHFMAHALERVGYGTAEATEANDDYGPAFLSRQ